MERDIVRECLSYIANKSPTTSLEIANSLKVDHQIIVGAVKSIQCSPEVIECEQVSSSGLELTAEGKHICEHGSHEVVIFNAIPKDGILQAQLMNLNANAKIGFSKAIAANWIRLDKTAAGGPRVFKNCDSVEDKVQINLKKIADGHESQVSDAERVDYKKRKLINELKITSYVVKKGSKFTTDIQKEENNLTAEMIENGTWKDKSFKAYNFDSLGQVPICGHLHPLLKVRAELRRIFFEMGFTEMPTDNYIESSFWNFDALFQPQQHPARDAHDTFFISDPANCDNFPKEYQQRVGKVHSEGGYGSQGYQYDWKLEEARKNLLRTHTTAVSARMLYKLAQQKEFKPAKYFSIDLVFRNENLDSTHLAEFHQVEGLVVDRGLNLCHLKGTLKNFFEKLGITQLRFKPAYNPYTEPSMEIFSYHKGLKKWVEIGNSGIFRPEMLLPMGLPEDVSVIAWGLSLERPTMIKYGYNNIRDLIGAKVDMKMIYDAPICRIEKT